EDALSADLFGNPLAQDFERSPLLRAAVHNVPPQDLAGTTEVGRAITRGPDGVSSESQSPPNDFDSIFVGSPVQYAENEAQSALLGSVTAFGDALALALAKPNSNGTSGNSSIRTGPCTWSTYGEGSVVDDTVSMGVADRLVSDTQPVGRRGASI